MRNLLWQPVFDRRGSLYGHESLIQLHEQADTGLAITTASPPRLWQISCELMARLTLAEHPRGLRHFVNMERTTLADPRCVDLLLDTQQQLARHDCQLVVEITERPLADPRLVDSFLRHLRQLHRQGILLALDDCPLPVPPALQCLLAERLCQYVKIDLRQLGVPSHPGADAAALHTKLDELLLSCIEHSQAALIAEVIETRWQHEYALGLPFSFFQGYYLQHPLPAPSPAR